MMPVRIMSSISLAPGRETVLRNQTLAVAPFLILTLASCEAPTPEPAHYTGPIAHVLETSHIRKVSRDIFYISAINGNEKFSVGGPSISSAAMKAAPVPGDVTDEEDIPAVPARFTIGGRTVFNAPIFCLANAAYRISGEVDFAPQADRNYIVLGSFSSDESSVWIEELPSGKILARVDQHGSTAAPLSEKLLGSACPGGN